MAIIYLALGSNLGDRKQYIQKAIDGLRANGIKITKVSTIIETDPVDSPPQGKYLNAVVKAQTQLSPEELIEKTQAIEHRLGRQRKFFHAPRVIDIDVLIYDDVKIISKKIIIPHPRMSQRDFVLNPLKEIDPQLCASLLP